MKFYTKSLHRIVKILKLESICVKVGNIFPLFRKLIPLPFEYKSNTFVKIKRDGAYFSVDRSDYMQWVLFANLPDQAWEQATLVDFTSGVFLDIGANCGQFSVKLAVHFMQQNTTNFHIHAFEPNPYVYDLLRANIELNPYIHSSISCHKLAVGKENTIKSFSYSSENTGGGSVINDVMGGINVTVVKLDDWVSELEIENIIFIKIDVEGLEPEVILGAEKLISSMRPVLYLEMTETWFEQRGYSIDQIIKKLYEWNYSLWGETPRGFLNYFENIETFSSLHQFNLLAKPQ